MKLKHFLNQFEEKWDNFLPYLTLEAENSFRITRRKIDFGSPNSLDYIPNDHGIYVIELLPKASFSRKKFVSDWDSFNKEVKSPTIIFSRFNTAQKNKDETFYFYLGKTEKLKTRLKQHCFHDINKKTYSLKLKSREHLIKSSDFFISYYELKHDNISHKEKGIMQFVITNLEKEFRKRFVPWVGKQ